MCTYVHIYRPTYIHKYIYIYMYVNKYVCVWLMNTHHHSQNKF